MTRALYQSISPDELRERFIYRHESGEIFHRHSVSNIKAGQPIGSPHLRHGYKQLRFRGLYIPAHRAAWAIHYGNWPPIGFQIDHIDGDRANNRIQNLRLCTNTQNQWNRKMSSHNTSGFKGVYYHKATGKWTSSIRMYGKMNYLGTFETPELAYAAYCEASVRLRGTFSTLEEQALARTSP